MIYNRFTAEVRESTILFVKKQHWCYSPSTMAYDGDLRTRNDYARRLEWDSKESVQYLFASCSKRSEFLRPQASAVVWPHSRHELFTC
jgi:hypothetical protein